jgi:hypothetical protein
MVGSTHGRPQQVGSFVWNGTTSWVPLSTLKESYPVERAEHAVAHELVGEAASSRWVPFTLTKRDVIFSAVKKRYGIQIPKSVAEAC